MAGEASPGFQRYAGDPGAHPLGGWPRGTICCKIHASLTRDTRGKWFLMHQSLQGGIMDLLATAFEVSTGVN